MSLERLAARLTWKPWPPEEPPPDADEDWWRRMVRQHLRPGVFIRIAGYDEPELIGHLDDDLSCNDGNRVWAPECVAEYADLAELADLLDGLDGRP